MLRSVHEDLLAAATGSVIINSTEASSSLRYDNRTEERLFLATSKKTEQGVPYLGISDLVHNFQIEGTIRDLGSQLKVEAAMARNATERGAFGLQSTPSAPDWLFRDCQNGKAQSTLNFWPAILSMSWSPLTRGPLNGLQLSRDSAKGCDKRQSRMYQNANCKLQPWDMLMCLTSPSC